MTRRIRFNAFDMNCVAHQSPGLWRHPADQSHRYKELRYWTELATLLERGRFDGLFIADRTSWRVAQDIDDAAANLLEARAIPIDLPAASGVLAFRWQSPAADPPPSACARFPGFEAGEIKR